MLVYIGLAKNWREIRSGRGVRLGEGAGREAKPNIMTRRNFVCVNVLKLITHSGRRYCALFTLLDKLPLQPVERQAGSGLYSRLELRGGAPSKECVVKL